MLCLDETALTISKHFRGEPNANSVLIGQFSVLKTNRKCGLREITLLRNCPYLEKYLKVLFFIQKQLIIHDYHWKHNEIVESFLLKLKWKEEKLPNQVASLGWTQIDNVKSMQMHSDSRIQYTLCMIPAQRSILGHSVPIPFIIDLCNMMNAI